MGPKAYVQIQVKLISERDGERSVVSSSESEFDATRWMAQVRRDEMAIHIIRGHAAEAAGDLIVTTLKRAIGSERG